MTIKDEHTLTRKVLIEKKSFWVQLRLTGSEFDLEKLKVVEGCQKDLQNKIDSERKSGQFVDYDLSMYENGFYKVIWYNNYDSFVNLLIPKDMATLC